jgi:hypothetical protein
VTRLSNSGNDLRSFMGELEELGELRAVNGADWNLEIGALTRSAPSRTGPRSCSTRSKAIPRDSGSSAMSSPDSGAPA